MLGIVYILVGVIIGYFGIKKYMLVHVMIKPNTHTAMVILPASFLAGTLCLTWVTYIVSYAASFLSIGKNPLFWGNLFSIPVFSIATLYLILHSIRNRKTAALSEKTDLLKSTIFTYKSELIFVISIVCVSSFLMFYTFNIKGNLMYIGSSVWGDFGPHLAMIRSFSLGSNFPTQYPHFAAGNVRYHFLFQFLAGNLEFLGLRIDWAFNIPSILSMVSFYMLLYAFAVLVTGKRWVGFITTVLFFFRSSFAFFTYIAEYWGKSSFSDIVNSIINNRKYIGNTINEDWGLWNQNVYINQRHFPFALAILLLILIVVYPCFNKMILSLKENSHKNTGENLGIRIRLWLSEFFLSPDAWLPESITRSVVLGLALGLTAFWNGAVVFAALPILFFMALFSKHRLEYFNISVITILLSLVQSALFIGVDSKAAVSPKIFVGFLANTKDINGILTYYIQMLGVSPIIMITALFILPKGMRWLSFAFLAPLLMATTVQLTPDINANHKFIIVTVILMNIIVAYFLYKLFFSKKILMIISAVILTLLLTVTGVVDFITLYNKNTQTRSVVMQTDDPIKIWIQENTNTNEIFLTDTHVIHPILLAGRKLFLGWTYYAWSAGYDTTARKEIAGMIYGATSSHTLKRLISENGISYIVIEEGNRNSQNYKLSENLIKKNFALVFNDTKSKISIYRTY